MASTTDTPPIQVYVTVDVEGKPHVTCSPYTMDVSAPTTLQFQLMSTGWAFPATNAVYLNVPPNANFPDPSVTVSSNLVTWSDAFASGGDIGYSVCVQKSTGGYASTNDPVIHNNDSTH
ncbi:MAG: hypothetical protein ACTHL8_08680 [Burkholderiaceae bacterium]